jgi:cytochrome c1
MKKFFVLTVSVAFAFMSSADAAVYKGQKEFSKNCTKCHRQKQAFIASHTIQEWKNIVGKDGQNLAKIHLDTKKAKNSWSYFKSSRYTKKVRHLKQFLVEYAKDSGNVPACN